MAKHEYTKMEQRLAVVLALTLLLVTVGIVSFLAGYTVAAWW